MIKGIALLLWLIVVVVETLNCVEHKPAKYTNIFEYLTIILVLIVFI